MDLTVIINGVIALFLIMLIGVYGSKRKIITPTINKGLTNILLEISLPCLVVSSFIFDMNDDLKSNIIKCFIYSPISLIITMIVSYIALYPIKSDKKIIMQFANVFSNCGFVGFPIIYSIFGNEGIIYASIFNMFFTIAVWTYGVMLFNGNIDKKDLKKVLLNPSIIAVIIGLIIMIFKINIPDVLYSTLELVGGLTSPLSMIIIGVILGNANILKYLKDYTIYYSSLLKLILLPCILILVSRIINDTSMVSKTLIIITAMPAAAMTSILAENFDKEKEYSAVIVFITTLIFLVTFPMLLKFIL
ncbi:MULTISPECIES: AEC family transporter [unclassified Clostridium]|uniref:AEC family transporter n=1 Tax=Clostridium TaxID=1485 RepID=UPI001C8C693D|nr:MULTISPECIES: AEC family transporter [unclassified Clostridium]MBX9135934.1 AEC family transporter [Clostridium sp. K12(2020)]MBX9142664.1 AEC family transporter [Clostridium sp. K13]MDU2291671.1 AEC family transporter [Clostridium celatum]MDU4327116.1 AEC family transporter [Clostridium celatum]